MSNQDFDALFQRTLQAIAYARQSALLEVIDGEMPERLSYAEARAMGVECQPGEMPN